MAKYTHLIDGVAVDYTAEEETIRDAEIQAWNDASADRKLEQIKKIRLQKLIETDYLALADTVLSDEVKTWRQSLRDIPSNHTDEPAYDLLLARETDKTKSNFGNLTHAIWSKP
tara:strand:+ start:532 stop:873 length:342 start_codon:yes stop_codon:yes gene_type:complete